ncbi:tryptophan synthase beta subunit-like PLP-dependent enzyme [Melampsora americana]|nr:tryptophan synthase beta subunit-like PLP-dependent enzyme [Melampsora americana]
MHYFSTRGGDSRLSFEETVLAGLAPNGGLYIPSSIPSLPQNWQSDWESLSFTELALEIYSLYIPTTEISRQDLFQLIKKSYSTFSDPSIAPIKTLDPTTSVLELWHGPTFAFKDIALQFLGNLFEFFLARKNSTREQKQRITVIGATSGDTGSAAIYGLRGKKDVSIFILHPKGRVSPIQEAQMTTVLDSNVFNLAVEGTFDDCQDIVKTLFSDAEFKHDYQLGAINSINWARILAQIVYYFSSYFELRRNSKPDVQLQYVVPTGNFGDILAGFYAYKMGLPMGSSTESCPGLVIATNANDILTRFWETGAYEKSHVTSTHSNLDHSGQPNPTECAAGASDGKQVTSDRNDTQNGGVKETLSPAMDILVSSNFERLLFYLALDTLTGSDSTEEEKIRRSQAQVNEWMKELRTNGKFVVPAETLSLARKLFLAGRASDEETCEMIRSHFEREGDRYIVDPHTAVGLFVAQQQKPINPSNIVQLVLATAHPAKFSEAVERGLSDSKSWNEVDFETDVLPEAFKGLLEKPKKIIPVHGIEAWKTKEIVIEEVKKLFGDDH